MSCPIPLNTVPTGAVMVEISCCDKPDIEPECCEEISINNWDEMPQGIEVSVLAGFCVYDDDENLIGKTFKCKEVDEETGATTWSKKIDLIGAADVVDYDPATHGIEQECNAFDCEEDTQEGLKSSWT